MTTSTKALGDSLSSIVAHGAVLTGLLCPAGPAIGAAEDAWAAYEKEVATACAEASNLRSAKACGKIVEFDDSVGFSALVIDGRYPQPHMQNQRGRVLCLFDKRTRKAFVSGADAMIGKGRR